VPLAERVHELAAGAELLHKVHVVDVLKDGDEARDVEAARERAHRRHLVVQRLEVRALLALAHLGRRVAHGGRRLGDRLARDHSTAVAVRRGRDDAERAAADLLLERVVVVQVALEAKVKGVCSQRARFSEMGCKCARAECARR
jgi:hypothetical protein